MEIQVLSLKVNMKVWDHKRREVLSFQAPRRKSSIERVVQISYLAASLTSWRPVLMPKVVQWSIALTKLLRS